MRRKIGMNFDDYRNLHKRDTRRGGNMWNFWMYNFMNIHCIWDVMY